MNQEEYEDVAAVYDALPHVVKEWTDAASDVSNHNEFAASVNFFVLLGSIVQRHGCYPNGKKCGGF